MSIKLGNTSINKVYLGSTPINKIYLGDKLIIGGGVDPEPPENPELFTGNAASDVSGEVNSTDGWLTVGGTLVSVNSTDPQTGLYCIEGESTDAGGTGDRLEFDVPIENGEQYEVSLWAKESVGSDGRIQLWSGVSGWSTKVLNSTWTEYTATVTATSSTMKMRFYPNNGSGNIGDKILIDNISVKKVVI